MTGASNACQVQGGPARQAGERCGAAYPPPLRRSTAPGHSRPSNSVGLQRILKLLVSPHVIQLRYRLRQNCFGIASSEALSSYFVQLWKAYDAGCRRPGPIFTSPFIYSKNK